MAVTSEAEPRQGFRYILALRDFRLVWFAQLAAQLADKFLMFSLIILAYGVSGGSTPVAITLLAYTVPAVVISPLAGVFADRHHRKAIMVWTNFGRAGLVALIPIASLYPPLRHDFLHLLVITFAFSAVGQLFSPAEAAAIGSIVPRRALITANSMVLSTMVLTLVLGGALAPIVSRIEIYAPYWLATALFAVSGVLITMARIPSNQLVDTSGRHPFAQMVRMLRDGVETLRGSPVLLVSFIELSVAVLVMFMMFTLAPAYVSQVVGIQAQDSYIILVPATLGALLSAAALGQFGRQVNKAWLLVVALCSTGATLVVLAGGPFALRHFADLRQNVTTFTEAFSLLLGLEFGLLLIPGATYLMEHTEDHVRGRIFALLYMVINGASAVPVLAAAALSDTLGIDRVLGGLGVLLALTGVLTAGVARRVFASTEPPAPPGPQAPGRRFRAN